MNFYYKYLKYKKKYLLLKGGGKRGRDDDYNDEREIKLFRENDLLTNNDLEIEHLYFSQKFVISAHGSQLVDHTIYKIRIPENFYIYFQSCNGESTLTQDYDMSLVCFDDDDFVGEFENKQRRPDYNDDENSRTFYWRNKYNPGDIIYDCSLGPDYQDETEPTKKSLFKAKIYFCGTDITDIIYDLAAEDKILKDTGKTNDKSVLLSQILYYIQYYIEQNAISPPYDIFCSICLDRILDINYIRELPLTQIRYDNYTKTPDNSNLSYDEYCELTKRAQIREFQRLQREVNRISPAILVPSSTPISEPDQEPTIVEW
jgi:hypothetical protein